MSPCIRTFIATGELLGINPGHPTDVQALSNPIMISLEDDKSSKEELGGEDQTPMGDRSTERAEEQPEGALDLEDGSGRRRAAI